MAPEVSAYAYLLLLREVIYLLQTAAKSIGEYAIQG